MADVKLIASVIAIICTILSVILVGLGHGNEGAINSAETVKYGLWEKCDINKITDDYKQWECKRLGMLLLKNVVAHFFSAARFFFR